MKTLKLKYVVGENHPKFGKLYLQKYLGVPKHGLGGDAILTKDIAKAKTFTLVNAEKMYKKLIVNPKQDIETHFIETVE